MATPQCSRYPEPAGDSLHFSGGVKPKHLATTLLAAAAAGIVSTSCSSPSQPPVTTVTDLQGNVQVGLMKDGKTLVDASGARIGELRSGKGGKIEVIKLMSKKAPVIQPGTQQLPTTMPGVQNHGGSAQMPMFSTKQQTVQQEVIVGTSKPNGEMLIVDPACPPDQAGEVFKLTPARVNSEGKVTDSKGVQLLQVTGEGDLAQKGALALFALAGTEQFPISTEGCQPPAGSSATPQDHQKAI
jgi:hypothetical protein